MRIEFKGTITDLIDLSCEKKDRNEEIAYSKGFENLCICCGKGIKDIKTSHWIRLVNFNDSYYTEDETLEEGADFDQGWFPIGNTCYRKYKKEEKDVIIFEKKENCK